ncbi:MAG: hypothetical protein M3440_06935, partial [Chloroflexota bacterium]|nr:hypothetical protein [Chloroflexota bacterium]
YWNTLFTTDSSEDLVLGELRWLDPGRFAHPALERFLYFRHRPEDAPTRARLFQNGIDEPPPDGDNPDDLKEWIKAFKRRLVLEGVRSTNDSPIQIDPLDLLPYGSAKEIVQILSGEMEPNTLLPRVLKGISRSDGIQYSAGQDGLVLRVRKSEEYGIEMVKVFPESEFDLQVSKGQRSTLIETTPRMLVLSHGRSSSTVHLNLDLIDILLRLAAGLEPATVELQPLLEELLTFKSRIQRSVSDRLLILDGTRKHWLVKEGDKLVRTDA